MSRSVPGEDVRCDSDQYEQRRCSKQKPPAGKPMPLSLTVFRSRQFRRGSILLLPTERSPRGCNQPLGTDTRFCSLVGTVDASGRGVSARFSSSGGATGTMNRYPCPVIVCMNRGHSASSFSACRSFRIAPLMLLSVSRKTPLPHPLETISSRVTISSRRSSSRRRISNGIRSSFST
jgi:hypothetical protein